MPFRRAACGLLIASLLAACSDEGPRSMAGGPPPAAVEVVTVEPRGVRDVHEFAGALMADESVVVKAETSGIVSEVAFSEGEKVKKGDLLFRLRDEEQRARLQEAEAAQVLAERVHQRAQHLSGEGVVSAAELDRAKAEIAQARARVEVARVELARTEIRAPFDGMVGARLVSPGDRVMGGMNFGGSSGETTGLVQIDAVDRLKLVFSVPEVAIPIMQVGAPVEMSVVPYPDERFRGEVYFVAPSVDPRNRRVLLKAYVPNPEYKMRGGMSATVFLEIDKRDDALVVPEASVVYDVAGSFVWRLRDDDTAERVPVEMGVREEGTVEITKGLEAGDRIVSAGTHKVVAGQPLSFPGMRAAKAADDGDPAVQ
jgi:membrane fusion protein (multidrug efflux system)